MNGVNGGLRHLLGGQLQGMQQFGERFARELELRRNEGHASGFRADGRDIGFTGGVDAGLRRRRP